MVVVDGENNPGSSRVEEEEDSMETDQEACAPDVPVGSTQAAASAGHAHTPLQILNKGPGYIRERMMRRSGGECFFLLHDSSSDVTCLESECL